MTMTKEEIEKLIVRKIKDIEEYKKLCKNLEKEIEKLQVTLINRRFNKVEFKPKNKG